MVAWKSDNGRAAAVVGAVRTPMVKSGAALNDTPMTELARTVISELLYRTGWSPARLDEVVLGNVVMPADAANPARVAAVQAGVPDHVPAYSVQRNCASGIESVAQAAISIQRGAAKAILAGGAESISTIPLLFPPEAMQPMSRLAKARSAWRKGMALATFRPRHFRPIPGLLLGLTDPLCDMIMGKTAEVLAHEFDISREQQDRFALCSHQRAASAAQAGRFDHQIVPVYAGKDFRPVTEDIGPRQDQTIAALARLRPLFDKRDGTVTVGNSCQVTDGAAAALLLDEEVARAEGLEVLGRVRAYATAATDPARMGLGPVFAIDRLLRETGMTLDDIDLFEINEAFAAQVLACIKAMASDEFCRSRLGRDRAIGELDQEKLNVNGGGIALGHPVGATGTRLIVAALDEMRRRDAQLAIAGLCVEGGQGAAILLQRG